MLSSSQNRARPARTEVRRMSEMFSRRVFLRGLGVVAAAAALTACSSTNEAVNQALIEGAVGGIVAAD